VEIVILLICGYGFKIGYKQLIGTQFGESCSVEMSTIYGETLNTESSTISGIAILKEARPNLNAD
jgi:hypothetical protein